MENNLIALSEVGGFIQQFQLLQRQMKEIQEALRIQPTAVSPATPTPEDSHFSDFFRFFFFAWAEQMDRLDPPGEGSSSKPTTSALRKVAEVSKCTKQHLVRSSASMDNEDHRKLAHSFALPKVAVTKTPDLDKIMAAQCSKSIKTNDQEKYRILCVG